MRSCSLARRAVGPLAVAALAAWLLGGCAHPQTAPEPAAAHQASYRRQNLFAAFDPSARDVSLPNAYLPELACFVGDKGTFELDKTLKTWGFTRRREFRDIQTSTYGFVTSNDRMILVTFADPTFLTRDLLSDADSLQLVYDERYCATPDARVHRGFRDSLNSVIDGVIDEVRQQAVVEPAAAGMAEAVPATRPAATRSATERAAARRAGAAEAGTSVPAADPPPVPRQMKLWIAGHSRGGAFAALAAAAFAKAGDGPEVAGVYTFGQPRVGNEALALQLDVGLARVPLFRLVNRDDPVASIPFGTPPVAGRVGVSLDYEHAGTMVLLREDARVVRSFDPGPSWLWVESGEAAALETTRRGSTRPAVWV